MPDIYLETSALAWPEFATLNFGSFVPNVSPYVLEELAALPDSAFKEELVGRASLLASLSLAPEVTELTEFLTKKLQNWPFKLLRHLALAQATGQVALLTDDERLLALPTLLALKNEPWPTIASPASLKFPVLSYFSQWAQNIRLELAKEIQNRSLSQKEELAQDFREKDWRQKELPAKTPGQLALQGGYEDHLEPLCPDPQLDFSLWLDNWRRA
jgi:hypothetical protein